jgi:hypothetical protein
MKIYKCAFGFKYANEYVSIILIAPNYNEARNKMVTKCLANYDNIMKISRDVFYDKYEHRGEEPPEQFNTIEEFEKYLLKNINKDTIECVENCEFEIVNKYD